MRLARSRLLLALLAAPLTGASAQITFDPSQTVVTAPGSNGVLVVGDFDGDGLPDLITGGVGLGSQRLHLNLGGLVFAAGVPLPVVGDYDRAIAGATGDIDQDGDVDALIAQQDYDPNLGISYRTVLFRNDGSGGFTPTTIHSPGTPWDVQLVDLNGDGWLDYLSSSDDGVFWLANDGASSFVWPGAFLTTALVRPRSARTGDLDGDGDRDVLATSYDDRVVWMENLGGGSFGALRTITTTHLNPYCVRAGDVDGDGDDDVLVGSYSKATPLGQPNIDGVVAWYENLDGLGSFGPRQELHVEYPGGSATAELVDLDADGRLDAVWEDFDALAWRRGLGGGAFAPLVTHPLTAFGARSLALADVDGDHRLDALLPIWLGGVVDALRQQPNPAATAYCDGQGLSCPCGNAAGTAEGCRNSTGDGGYMLWTGSASLAADDLGLRVFQAVPGAPGLLLQGTTTVQLPISDGLLCVGGATNRLKVVFFDADGEADVTDSLGSLSVGAAPGLTGHFQVWYRDTAPGPCSTGSNLTGAVSVTWQ